MLQSVNMAGAVPGQASIVNRYLKVTVRIQEKPKMLNGYINTQSGRVRAPGLETRGAVQLGRVRTGVQNGSITESELSELRSQRQEARSQLNEFKANDGRVDYQERAALHKDLNSLSDSIRKFKSDSPHKPLGEKESFQSSIIGDPHFAMAGEVNGEAVDAKFDNHDLGDRTQIAGAGFKLETNTVEWGSKGAAVVGSASVTTGFGKGQKEVGFDADGGVTVNGNAVELESGQTVNLNRTSTLSYNEDGTYTVSSRNGKVTNTLSMNEHANGNYLNIYTSVDDVQTVGWFQNQV